MLQGKNVIIMGASRGIGKAIAKLLAKNKANLCLISRTQEELQKIVTEIIASGHQATYLVGDVSKIEDVKLIFEKYGSSGKKIDVLVNNAGIYRENSETHPSNIINIKEVYSLVHTNMLSYWWTVLLAKEQMNCGSSIINISSVNGILGKGNSDIYDMTKAAINNLTLNQARQLFAKKIRVNAVCPSSTITPMRDYALKKYLKDKTRKEFDSYEADTIPFKRLGLPDDIAEAVLFLASNSSKYITGQIISVDGGYLLKPFFFNEPP